VIGDGDVVILGAGGVVPGCGVVVILGERGVVLFIGKSVAIISGVGVGSERRWRRYRCSNLNDSQSGRS
jgi:hypothetical protein